MGKPYILVLFTKQQTERFEIYVFYDGEENATRESNVYAELEFPNYDLARIE